jgi:hypothetical protein
VADWDSADLLARVKRDGAIPAVDEDMADADWYAYLTEAQIYWHGQFATHFPWILWSAPTLLVSADGGITYAMPGGVNPSKIEVYDAVGGRLLVPGAYWSMGADYVWEGSRIRMPRNVPRSFGDGPYARYIAAPPKIDAATQPVLLPDWARALLPPRALMLWADRGGLRDPAPYQRKENELWYGEPQRGQFGILVTLKTQNPFGGAAAIRRDETVSGLGYFSALYGKG